MRTHNAHLAASCMHGGPAVEKGRKDHFSVAIDIRLQYQKNTHGFLRQFSQPSISQHPAVKTHAASPHAG
ncbi:hypothetical protein [Komagataeibacter rhaeticus]|uniref:Uncharacterized protein n=1 Tax=Komagataeibacter rhaeticus TaxID=215221 RepID=A0A858JDV2_9PROT|nr:hypothetical protein [Komagataeibacter rhaeticus]QIP34921.1 hypothetical protein GWK63_04985 [Komagataeibacter rhaeticus]QOC47457.1 hypothetical protein ICJ78_04995 [Komagataeibacter rhaeticus]WPP21922.1 hypothetical protein SCD25_16260 [Komagataeibacter rhaeticus]